MDEADGVVDQVLAQVVALVGGARRVDGVVVVDQLGVELVGLALEEPVVPVEAALARPLVVGAGGRGVLHGAQVPLAHGEGGVPLVAQHLGHGGGVVGDVAAHVRVAAVEVGDRAHPDGVVVPAGEQRGPGGRAQGGDVEVGVAEPLRGQTVDVRGGQLGAVAAEVGEAGVVEEDEDHVGRVLAGVGRGRPPRGRLGLGAGDHAVEAVEGLHGGSLVGGSRMAGRPGRAPTSERARAAGWSGHRPSGTDGDDTVGVRECPSGVVAISDPATGTAVATDRALGVRAMAPDYLPSEGRH